MTALDERPNLFSHLDRAVWCARSINRYHAVDTDPVTRRPARAPRAIFRFPELLLDRQRWPRVRQAGSKTRLPSVLPAVAMPTMVPKLTNGSNSLARSAAKPTATARLESKTPGPLTR